MCLKVKPIKHSYKLKTIDGENYIPVWKVLTVNNESPTCVLWNLSDASSYTWKYGCNISSWKPSFCYAYPPQSNITHGFHFCLTKKDAEEYRDRLYDTIQFNSQLKVVKMYIKKDDVLGKGTCVLDSNHFKGIAATKAYWLIPTPKINYINHSFLSKLIILEKYKQNDEMLDLVYDHMDTLMYHEKIDEIISIFQYVIVNEQNYSYDILLALQVVTLPVHKNTNLKPYRTKLREIMSKRRESKEPDALKGL